MSVPSLPSAVHRGGVCQWAAATVRLRDWCEGDGGVRTRQACDGTGCGPYSRHGESSPLPSSLQYMCSTCAGHGGLPHEAAAAARLRSRVIELRVSVSSNISTKPAVFPNHDFIMVCDAVTAGLLLW